MNKGLKGRVCPKMKILYANLYAFVSSFTISIYPCNRVCCSLLKLFLIVYQKKKASHSGLEQNEGNFHFGVNDPFKAVLEFVCRVKCVCVFC